MRLDETNERRHRLARFLVCSAILAVLVIWLVLWPYTGDGDSAPHYLNLRESASEPACGLSAWAW